MSFVEWGRGRGVEGGRRSFGNDICHWVAMVTILCQPPHCSHGWEMRTPPCTSITRQAYHKMGDFSISLRGKMEDTGETVCSVDMSYDMGRGRGEVWKGRGVSLTLYALYRQHGPRHHLEASTMKMVIRASQGTIARDEWCCDG